MKYYQKRNGKTEEISKSKYYSLTKKKNKKVTVYYKGNKPNARVIE